MLTSHSFSVNNPEKGFLSFITILLFLILIATFAWGIFYFRQQPISRELPSKLQQQIPSTSPTPGPVETYTNSDLGFQFEYPRGGKIKEVVVLNSKILHPLLEITPAGYTGSQVPFKLLSVDNPNDLSLKDLDQKLSGKTDAAILYSIDDVYMLTGSGLAVSFRNEGDCIGKKCQVYTFSRDNKVYQLVSYLDANIFEQKQIFDRIINSFRFDDFTTTDTMGASVSASPLRPRLDPMIESERARSEASTR